jgi:hypothetical protein
MDGTILCQGTFTSSGPAGTTNTVVAAAPVTVQIPSNADWMWVYNYTQSGTSFASITTARVLKAYWQRGMPAGSAFIFQGAASSTVPHTLAMGTITSNGFTLYDPSGQTTGAQPQYSADIAITTGVSDATQPVVTTTNTTGLVAASSTNPGSVVRIQSPGFPANGIDFTVGAVNAGTSFTLLSSAAALATAPGAAGTLGNYTIQNFNALYYPRRRYITNITKATQGVVSTNVPHGLTPGQVIRFNIPAVSGMIELNPTAQNNYLYATVVSVSSTDANVFTINIDTTGFTTFTWPTSAQAPSSFPEMTPLGEDTATALASPTIQIPGVSSATLGSQIYNTNSGILADSTVNTGFLGMVLGTGGPSGYVLNTGGTVTYDTMYWVAGKSTYGGL